MDNPCLNKILTRLCVVEIKGHIMGADVLASIGSPSQQPFLHPDRLFPVDRVLVDIHTGVIRTPLPDKRRQWTLRTVEIQYVLLAEARRVAIVGVQG